jgi:hypothetical protein
MFDVALRPDDLTGTVVLITGATNGLGRVDGSRPMDVTEGQEDQPTSALV